MLHAHSADNTVSKEHNILIYIEYLQNICQSTLLLCFTLITFSLGKEACFPKNRHPTSKTQ